MRNKSTSSFTLSMSLRRTCVSSLLLAVAIISAVGMPDALAQNAVKVKKDDVPKNELPLTSALPFATPQASIQLKPDAAFSAYQQGHYLTAFALATQLAGEGQTSAQTLLGELYRRGLGVNQDLKEAANWFSLAADSGDKEAQYALGLLHTEGKGVKKDPQKAIELFTKAAEQNQKDAQFNLAYLYLQGRLVKRDFTKALDLFTKSAKQGHSEAQYALANLYKSDYFPSPDFDQTAYWMKQSASNGLIDAQLEYALMLFKGQGVAKDIPAAKSWLEQAANAGSTLAQNRLARILARGFEAPPEPVKAARYYLMSKKAGKKDEWLENFYQSLTEAQKQQAHKATSQQNLW